MAYDFYALHYNLSQICLPFFSLQLALTHCIVSKQLLPSSLKQIWLLLFMDSIDMILQFTIKLCTVLVKKTFSRNRKHNLYLHIMGSQNGCTYMWLMLFMHCFERILKFIIYIWILLVKANYSQKMDCLSKIKGCQSKVGCNIKYTLVQNMFTNIVWHMEILQHTIGINTLTLSRFGFCFS